jgi:hypothetical protein
VDVRRHLAPGGEFPELAPAEFYLHLEEGGAGGLKAGRGGCPGLPS